MRLVDNFPKPRHYGTTTIESAYLHDHRILCDTIPKHFFATRIWSSERTLRKMPAQTTITFHNCSLTTTDNSHNNWSTRQKTPTRTKFEIRFMLFWFVVWNISCMIVHQPLCQWRENPSKQRRICPTLNSGRGTRANYQSEYPEFKPNKTSVVPSRSPIVVLWFPFVLSFSNEIVAKNQAPCQLPKTRDKRPHILSKCPEKLFPR